MSTQFKSDMLNRARFNKTELKETVFPELK
jgi:hypothetical protein